MSEETKIRAKKIFETAKKEFDSRDWHYKAIEEDNVIITGAKGDDLPIDIKMIISEELELAIVYSKIPVTISEDKRIEAAIAVNMVNNLLVDGCFEYRINTGDIFFRLTNSFADTELSGEILMKMVMLSCSVVDDYNDRFLLFNNGTLSLENFILEE